MSEMIDIHGLADGQLEGELKVSALNELSSNPKAKAEYDAVLGLKKTLQTHCQGVPNDELWKVCRGRLDGLDKTKTVEKYVSKYSWAVCGVLAVSIFSAHMFNRVSGGTRFNPGTTTQAAASFVPQRASGESIQQSLSRVTGMPIDHLVSSQVVTTSVAQGQVDGLPAYRFWLSDNHGALTLDIIKGVDRMEASENASDGITSGTVNGLASISWIKNGYGFTLVGDRSDRELRQVASGISLK